MGIVFNVGYNGAKGSGLDVVGSPNSTPAGVSTPGVAPFSYETSVAGSHANTLVVSVQKRQQKGIALGITYTYGHSIDNSSSIGNNGTIQTSGGALTTPGVQNFRRLDLEEGNSSFDVRQSATGNWLLELPFGPNRAYFNKGGFWSHALDNFSLSGTFTFATGSYFTPSYSGSQEEASSGNLFTLRPDRVFTQRIKGAGTINDFFNKAAFAVPAGEYGTASRNSIEGPGTVSVNASLSRTFTFGGTRSLEARVTASNVFNTVQYNGINTTENSANFGEVTSAAAMRSLLMQARYRFLEAGIREQGLGIRSCTMRRLVAAAMAGVVGMGGPIGAAQTPVAAPAPSASASQTASGDTYRLTLNANIVLTNMVVRDKKTGAVVKGLKASDFTIYEDKKPQKIISFDYQNVDEAAVLAETSTAAGKDTVADLLERNFAASPKELKDHRLIVLFFDLSSMQDEDIDRAVEAAQKYVKTQMQPADLVALVSMSTGLTMDQDFTSNKDALLRGLGRYTGTDETGVREWGGRDRRVGRATTRARLRRMIPSTTVSIRIASCWQFGRSRRVWSE